MANNKIFILLPDGIGLRNFAFSEFNQLGNEKGYEIVYWNNTVFDLKELGLKEIKIDNPKLHPLTDLLKTTKINISLNLFNKKTGDDVYQSYKFPFRAKTFKNKLKFLFLKTLIKVLNSEKGISRIDKIINKKERTTYYYKNCMETLKKEKPDFIFCTNQRPITAVAPLLAAQDLGIPTGTFIFSWDNLPKATMVVKTDFYFVWSKHMKRELLEYYPYINEEQIVITGTPQFESHFEKKRLLTKEDFFQQNGLDIHKKYICYSGDDITTCPDDSQYLEDVAQSVKKLNEKGNNFGVLFRRCPVDFSDRYDSIIEKYRDIIVPVEPQWKRIGEGWNTILPTNDDINLQMNTIHHTEMVVNLGSSMVFDYVAHQKPCAYINYDVADKIVADWSVKKIYNFVHFRSMPDKRAVVWLNSKEEIAEKIKQVLETQSTIQFAQEWFETINQHPPQEASKRIWKAIEKIIE